MSSHHPQHTGHEMSRSRAHESDRAGKDQGGQQHGDGKSPSPIDVQKALKGMDYPASKDEIVQKARAAHADDRIVDVLQQIPERDYETPASISKEIGKLI